MRTIFIVMSKSNMDEKRQEELFISWKWNQSVIWSQWQRAYKFYCFKNEIGKIQVSERLFLICYVNRPEGLGKIRIIIYL